MSQIFISYRRDDCAGHAGRLYDRLQAHFGAQAIFRDIDTIEPGMDFVEVIEDAVGSCKALLVLIGKQWSHIKDAEGRRRLELEDDFVRLEVATALNRNIRVIPVLLQGAPMPPAEQLPQSLTKLARRNSIELSDARWEFDVGRLVEVLDKALGKQPSPAQPPAKPPERLDDIPALIKRSALIKAEADDQFATTETASRAAKLNEAYALLQKANKQDPTNAEVLLRMAELLVELTPDDATDETRLLQRVKQLLNNPANEAEQFQVAQASFLLATTTDPIDTRALEEAREIFTRLNKADWIRRCSEALATVAPVIPKANTGFQNPNQSPAVMHPGQLTPAHFIGRWNVDIMAFIKNSMMLDLYPNGSCQGNQNMPFVGPVAFQGNWLYTPYNQVLQLQLVIQFMPALLAIVIQSVQGNDYQGTGADGIVYKFQRLG